jgi:hypothetical protein
MMCVAGLAVAMGIVLCTPVLGEEEMISNETCLDCHSDEELTMEGADGKEVSIFVDEAKLKASVHMDNQCADCHEDLTVDHPDDEKPAAPVNCASCHEETGEEFSTSVHGSPRANGMEIAATCITCHTGAHEMVPVKHLDSPVSKFNLPQLCGICHEDEKKAHELGLKRHDAIAHFRDSIHGQSLFKKGLIFAPSCNDCHGVHDIKPGADVTSRTNKARISETCTTCHKGVEKIYAKSAPGELLAKRDPDAPVCTDCHTAHDIERPSNAHFKANSDQSCGKCHQDRLEKDHETYHGKAMALGMANVAPDVAACYDCHGHHDVLPHTNPESRLSS